jgi:hypothetical protein
MVERTVEHMETNLYIKRVPGHHRLDLARFYSIFRKVCLTMHHEPLYSPNAFCCRSYPRRCIAQLPGYAYCAA